MASLLWVRNRAGIETQERILAATKRLLAERGLDGVTIKGICDAAEVHAGSFYNLFSSKEEVVLRVGREAIEAVDPDIAGEGTDTVEDLVEATSAFVEEQRDLIAVLSVERGLVREHFASAIGDV